MSLMMLEVMLMRKQCRWTYCMTEINEAISANHADKVKKHDGWQHMLSFKVYRHEQDP